MLIIIGAHTDWAWEELQISRPRAHCRKVPKLEQAVTLCVCVARACVRVFVGVRACVPACVRVRVRVCVCSSQSWSGHARAGSLCVTKPGASLSCGDQLSCAPLPGATTSTVAAAGLSRSGVGFCQLRTQAARGVQAPPATRPPTERKHSDNAKHESHWSCGPGCVAGVVVAAVACALVLAGLAAIAVRTRLQRASGPAAGSTYRRFEGPGGGGVGHASDIAALEKPGGDALPSFAADPKLQMELMRARPDASDSLYTKQIELSAPYK